METKDFKTMTMFRDRAFPSAPDKWILAVDIGYSSLKSISPNKVFCFPSYARKIPDNRIQFGDASDSDIRYRDEDGLWVVGELAYKEVNSTEVVDSEVELYGRHRYFSSMFQVIARTGLAIGLMENGYGKPQGRRIAVQTGLPPKYLADDTVYLKEALAGRHVFEVQIGNQPWKKFDFTLSDDDIYTMAQPLGSLISASVSADGKALPISKEYFSKNLIIIDPGFGTLDQFNVNQGYSIGVGQTFPEFGMREVLDRTCKDIKDVYGVGLTVPELQNKLGTGKVKVVDRKQMKSKTYSFASFLDNNCRKVCREAIEKLKSVNDYFANTDYIIATGGTYDAWKDIFDETFKDMENLDIIPANVNDPSLSNVFGNVRGYYFRLLNYLK